MVKILDVPVIIFSIALTVFIARSVYSGDTAPSQVTVRSPGQTWIYPLSAEESLTVTGFMGETTVLIREGRAAIVSSCCGGQTCVAAGDLFKNGQWAACLPNGVFVLIEGAGEDDVDAASW